MSGSPDPRSSSSGLAQAFGVLTAGTFLLIVFGAVVRAKGAGLACPDWPLCFGELLPRFSVRVALEWGHRLLAAGVSLGFAALSWTVLRRRELLKRLGWVLALAWVVLGVQIVLGGLTVLYRLVPWTVTGHLLAGNTFCVLLLWISRDLAEPAPGHRPREKGALPSGVRNMILAVAALVGLQVLFGGMVSSHAAGLACAHFPTCDGTSWAPTLHGLIGFHVVHRFGAYLVAAAFLVLAIGTRGVGRTGALARSGLRLVILQIALGVANVLFLLPVEVTVLHSAAATGIVLITALLVREWSRLGSSEPVSHRPPMEVASAG
jgi:cytochrome c oxidase assembly protein subunit 15